MEHLAILSKNKKFLDKILSGEKTIESRWYKFKKAPFKSIKSGENIYFKESGNPVSMRAKVKDVVFFEDLNPQKIKQLLLKYHKEIGVDLSYFGYIKDKRYCSLIFLKDIEKIKPFNINKKNYGIMSAWITISNIKGIKLK